MTDDRPVPDKLLALAATARLPNLPSVLSNVWLGVALAFHAAGPPAAVPWHAAGALMLAGCCLYLAGSLLNDWADRHWDARHRPERALPQRVFAASFYAWLGVAFGGLGLVIAAAVGAAALWSALWILLFVVLYTAIHKRSAWAFVPMAMCRALLPVLGYAGTSHGPPPWWIGFAGLALGLHVAGLSLAARNEARPGKPTPRPGMIAPLFLAATIVAATTALAVAGPPLAVLAGAAGYLAWIAVCLTRFGPPVSPRVANLLAGIPLVDWMMLLPVALAAAPHTFTSPAALISLCLPPLAVVAAISLQRVVPAT